MSAASDNKSKSIASKISKRHPESTIIAFDGYVMYGKVQGKPAIVGVSRNMKFDDKKGSVVTYKNGQEVSRVSFLEYSSKKL